MCGHVRLFHRIGFGLFGVCENIPTVAAGFALLSGGSVRICSLIATGRLISLCSAVESRGSEYADCEVVMNKI